MSLFDPLGDVETEDGTSWHFIDQFSRIVVDLCPADLDIAFKEAVRRQNSAVEHGAEDRYPDKTTNPLDDNYVGTQCECAAARVLALPWPTRGGINSPDLPNGMEVRGRRIRPDGYWPDLLLSGPKDWGKRDKVWILGVKRNDGAIVLDGWIWGKDAMIDEHKKKDPVWSKLRPAWLILSRQPPLRRMDELPGL